MSKQSKDLLLRLTAVLTLAIQLNTKKQNQVFLPVFRGLGELHQARGADAPVLPAGPPAQGDRMRAPTWPSHRGQRSDTSGDTQFLRQRWGARELKHFRDQGPKR